MKVLIEMLEIELEDFGVTIERGDESVEVYLKHPNSETYDEILEAIEEACDDLGFTVDGDYEGHLSIY